MTEQKSIAGFSQLLQTLEGGALHHDLSEELHNTLTEMATYAHGTGGGRSKGKIVLTLDFEQEIDTVKVRANVKTKTQLQDIARRASQLFLTPGNKLSVEHPQQNQLPFGTVVAGGAPRMHEGAAVVHSGQEHYDQQTGEVHA